MTSRILVAAFILGMFASLGVVKAQTLPAFDVSIAQSASGGGGNTTPMDINAYVMKLRGFAILILILMVLVAAVMTAAGQEGMLLAVVKASIVVFGSGWILIEIAHAWGKTK